MEPKFCEKGFFQPAPHQTNAGKNTPGNPYETPQQNKSGIEEFVSDLLRGIGGVFFVFLSKAKKTSGTPQFSRDEKNERTKNLDSFDGDFLDAF